jgi:hypothetical protein
MNGHLVGEKPSQKRHAIETKSHSREHQDYPAKEERGSVPLEVRLGEEEG